jgi:hypothetical protein
MIVLEAVLALCGLASAYAGDKNAAGAQIEYISPDGQLSSVAMAERTHANTAAFVDKDTVSCALREGATTFIIALPNSAARDRFAFLNENSAACGELKIAVSDTALAADSPKWVEVDGIVPFAHTRLFKLSMLGVDTKFVRLSFQVDNPRRQNGDSDRSTARVSDPFQGSLLAKSINSKLARIHSDAADISFASLSVGPLTR